jgi:hypothetical protein
MRRQPGATATARQLEVLAALIAGHRELGTAPSVKWLMKRLNVEADKTVIEILQNLGRHGLATVVDGKRVATPAGYQALGILTLVELEEALKRLAAGKADDELRAQIKRHFDAVAKLKQPT